MHELHAVRRLHQHATAMPRPSHEQSGFTLIELMFVVVLIGVMAAMIAPSLSRGRQDADTANFATGIVRLGTRARAHAQATGLAHTLVVITNGTATSVFISRGISSRCNSVVGTWAAAQSNDRLVTSDQRYSGGGQPMRLTFTNGDAANIQICAQPNGLTLLRAGDTGPFTQTVVVGGSLAVSDIGFSVFHGASWTARTGADRRVVFPSGNIPRWVQ